MDRALSRSELAALIDKALDMTGERLAGVPSGPTFTLFTTIVAQLRYMGHIVTTGAVPAPEDLGRLTLGVIAVREFESDDVEYCDVICDAVFAFKKL